MSAHSRATGLSSVVFSFRYMCQINTGLLLNYITHHSEKQKFPQRKKKTSKQDSLLITFLSKDQFNNKKLKNHNKTELKQYLFSANPESLCNVSPASVLTAIWHPSWNSQWSGLVN